MSVMNLRFARAVMVGLLLLQTGLLAPVAAAAGPGQAMSDCAEHLGTGDSDCPCCPQGVSTYQGCGTVCLGAFAGVSSSADVLDYAITHSGPGLPASLLASQTYTPVDPPPIA